MQARANLDQGNFIGTDRDGTMGLGNGGAGVLIVDSSQNQIVPRGTDRPANVISGNAEDGVRIVGAEARENVLVGNFIGVDKDGESGLDNGHDGVRIVDAPDNQIGQPSPVSQIPLNFNGNVVSANVEAGVRIQGTSASENRVQGNLIGTDRLGDSGGLGNDAGVLLLDAPDNQIGSVTGDASPGNTISDNREGVTIRGSGAMGNVLGANRIGFDAKGESIVGNRADGVLVEDASGNFIGGLLPDGTRVAGNMIAGAAFNGVNGVTVKGADADGNMILGNSIQDNMRLGIDLNFDGVTNNDEINELDDANPPRSDDVELDTRPRIEPKYSFRPGIFITGVGLENSIDTFVDWNGNLDGTDWPNSGEIQQLELDLNEDRRRFILSVPSEQPYTASYDMGDLTPGGNLLTTTAIGAFGSRTHEQLFRAVRNARWLSDREVTVDAEPSRAQYDKIAAYNMTVGFPKSLLRGLVPVPDSITIGQGDTGIQNPTGEIGPIFRSDNTSTIAGALNLGFEAANRQAFAATGQFEGKLRQGRANLLSLDVLHTMLRAEGSVSTPVAPLPPPFSALGVKGKIGAGIDVAFDFLQTPDEELEFDNLIFGVDVSLAGVLQLGRGPVSVGGGLGGKPRAEFVVPADPCLIHEFTFQFLALVEADFFGWSTQKTFEFPEPPFQVFGCEGAGEAERSPVVGPSRLGGAAPSLQAAPAPVHSSTVAATQPNNSLPAIDYPFAAPDLARGPGDTRTLVYVEEDPEKAEGQHLEIFATTFDGAQWSTPVALTDNTLLDGFPSVAYDSNGQAVAMWTQLTTEVSDQQNTDPKTVLGSAEVVYAVRDAQTGQWSAPARLTQDTELDMLPRVEADEAGNVTAMWLHESDNDLPIFPDDSTSLGADILHASWDGANWSKPVVGVESASTNEAPQLARNDDQAIRVWSEDGDADPTTLDERSIQASTWDGVDWSPPQTLGGANDALADIQRRAGPG